MRNSMHMCINITWHVPLCEIIPHILIIRHHVAYSLRHIYWAPIKNQGRLLLRPLMLQAKSSEKFVPIRVGQTLAVWGHLGLGSTTSSDFTAKGTTLRKFTSCKPFCVKIDGQVWHLSRLGKSRKSGRSLASRIPQWCKYHKIWLLGRVQIK